MLASAVLPSFSTYAADIDLAVKGTILLGSCTPDFENGGVIDYGTMSGLSLSSTRYTDLPEQQLDFSILCSTQRKVAFKLLPSRIGSLADSDDEGAQGFGHVKHAMPNTTPSFLQAYGTGIGLDAKGGKIGGMLVNIQDRVTIVDGTTSYLFLEGGTGNYAVKNSTTTLNSNATSTNHYTWGDYDSGGYVPIAFKTAESTLDIYTFLNKRDELDLTQEVNFDGSLVFELVYL